MRFDYRDRVTMRYAIPPDSVAIYQRDASTVYRVPPEEPAGSPEPTGTPAGRSEIWKVLDAGARGADRDHHRTEYLLLRRLQRIHWPTVHDFRILEDGSRAIVMDEAGGRTLADLRLPAGFGLLHLRICRQILAALDALHWTGHAHADLKPEHVFVDLSDAAAPSVTLIDLGLAVPFGERRQSGTPRDIPPEILCDNEPWSPASDHYLFGLVLYHLILGTFPRSEKQRWEDGWVETLLPNLPFDAPLEMTRLLRSLLGPVSERPVRALQIWTTLREMFPQHADATDRLLHESESDPAKLPPFPIVGREEAIRCFEREIESIETRPGELTAHCHVEGEIGSGRQTLIGHLGGIAETRGWRRTANRSRTFTYRRQATTARLEFHVEPLPELRGRHADSPVRIDFEATTPAALRELRFHIRVAPLTAAEMEALAGTRLESPRLIARSAQICLGNPGLLEALLPTIPRLTDFVSRDFPGAWNEFDHERLDPPRQFIDFAKAVGAHLPRDLRRIYGIVAIVDGQWDPNVLAGLTEAPPEEWMGHVAPTAYPGLFDPASAVPRFSSSLWRTAWLRAHHDECRDLAERILPSISPAASGDQLADACRVAFELGIWEHGNRLLDRGLRKLHQIEMYGRELDLLRHALDHVPESELRISAARFAAVAEIIQLQPRTAGSALPPRFAAGEVPAKLKRDLRRTLTAAALYGQGKFERVLEVLEPLEAFSGGPPSLEWVVLYAESLHLRSQVPLDWIVDLEKWPQFSNPRARVILRVVACSSPDPDRVLGLLEEIDGLAGGADRLVAGFCARSRAGALFQKGSLDESLVAARHAEAILRSLEVRVPHALVIQHLSAILYEKAALAEAYSSGRLFVRELLGLGRPVGASEQMLNQALCALERGRFDLALADIESLRTLSAYNPKTRVARARAEAYLAQYAGLTHLLPNQLDDWIVEAAIGLTHLVAGNADLGREVLQQTLAKLTRMEQMDDVAELTLEWMICEADLGNADRARALWIGLDPLVEHLTPRSRLKLLVAQNTLTLAGWIDAADELGPLLAAVLEALRRTDYGSLVWRSCWHLSELNRRAGRSDLATRWRDEARRHLYELARGLAQGSWQRSFLELPAQRRFLAEA